MTEQIQAPTKVFISYSWDSDDHKNKVLGLANTLRSKVEIDADIDLYVRANPPYTPVQGWDLWMSERIEWAEFVLIIFTETYKRRFEGKEEPGEGLGVSWEGTIIRNDLYKTQLRDTKFIPVVFSPSDLGYVPLLLNSRDKYILTDEKSFTELCYRLRKQNTIIKPEIKGVPLRLPSKPELFSPQKPPVESLEQQTPEEQQVAEKTAVKVFISYSWDCDEHKHRVLLLANSLKKYGIDSKIDRYQQAPSEGWYRWMMNQIQESDFVLVVCTEKYNLRYQNKEKPGQGRGVTWEGGLIIAQLYDGQGINDKFIPILLSPDDEKHIPLSLRTYTVYQLFDAKYDPKIPGEFQNLYRHLTNQPEYEEPKLGKRLILPPIQPASSNVGGDGEIIKGEGPDNTQKEAEQQQVNDPEIGYRKKVEEYVNRVSLSEPYKEISNINKKILERIRQRIGLDTDKAKAIENAVLQSRCQRHEQYKQNLQEYQNLLKENLEKEDFFSDDILSDLKELQNNWEISDKDAEELLLYAQLEYSLKKENWIKADETTTKLLLKVANVQQNYFSETDFYKIPCKDIHKIDKLWTDYSKGHFGYSAQIDIWQQVNGELLDLFVELDWGYKEDRRFVYTDKFKYNLSNPPKGHRPASVLWDGGSHQTRQAYIERIQKCCKDFAP